MHPEGLPDDGGLLLVDDNVPGLVGRVADRQRGPTVQTLLRGLPHASHDLLAEVGGVVLGQALQDALQNDPLRAIRHGLPGIHEVDACPLQLHFTEGYVLAIPPEAVNLPDDDALEAPLLRVVQHPEELIPTDDALP